MTAISAGKLLGLRRLADAGGRFAMLAIDQRRPIMRRLERVGGEARDEEVSAVERLLAEELAPLATATLADPIWALPFVWDVLDPARGLILTLESHAFEETSGGRITHPIERWSVAKTKRLGADAVKLQLFYRPDAALDVREEQAALVRVVGAACRSWDLPFVLALSPFPLPGEPETRTNDRRAELVLDSVRTFADEIYSVDLFAIESPIPPESLPEPGEQGSGRAAGLFADLDFLAARPWVMLSAGASPGAFGRVLSYAYAAGASGFLAGRAIWWEAFAQWPAREAMRARLRAEAIPCWRELLSATEARARPWWRHPRFGTDGPRSAGAGHDFPAGY
ncbi:MAG: tagatose 1,6-diphosphate aldolase, partial [Geminicoccaceae bacterium]|nr:tagatose 1,6-diphosphate aldolase [Geminicoccaceae bacterium]